MFICFVSRSSVAWLLVIRKSVRYEPKFKYAVIPYMSQSEEDRGSTKSVSNRSVSNNLLRVVIRFPLSLRLGRNDVFIADFVWRIKVKRSLFALPRNQELETRDFYFYSSHDQRSARYTRDEYSTHNFLYSDPHHNFFRLTPWVLLLAPQHIQADRYK